MAKTRKVQCTACPWKKSTNPHTDIPGGYDPVKHAELIGCQSTGFGSTIRAMACHESRVGAEYPCVGWVINQLGPGNNIPLRVLALSGEFEGMRAVGPQHESLEAMVATARGAK